MRIDKYLWCIRIFKTRSVAAEAIKKGHVSINNQQAKASRDVFVGDKLNVRKDQITYTYTVLDVPQNRLGAKLVDMYRKDDTPKEAFEHLELLKILLLRQFVQINLLEFYRELLCIPCTFYV